MEKKEKEIERLNEKREYLKAVFPLQGGENVVYSTGCRTNDFLVRAARRRKTKPVLAPSVCVLRAQEDQRRLMLSVPPDLSQALGMLR